MAPHKYLVLCAAIACCTVAAQAQGTFQNLGFESATLVPISGTSPSPVQFGPAFPGWTGSVGGVQLSGALYNSEFLDSSGISIVDQGWANPLAGPSGTIEGNYTAILQAGLASGPGGTLQPADTALSQTGLVPLGTQSLRFKAYPALGQSGSFSVSIDGQPLSLAALSSGTNYTLFGADIGALAGQTAQLTFTVFADRPHVVNEYLYLDSIQFSAVAIPEPRVLGLPTLGALLLSWRLWRKRR